MALEAITVDLRAYSEDGLQIPDSVFIDRLTIAKKDGLEVSPSKEEEQAALITLASLELKKFRKKEDPHDAFSEAVQAALVKAGEWLERQDPEVFERMRAAGFSVDVFIGLWLESDQFDLTLPHGFLSACGTRALKIQFISNE